MPRFDATVSEMTVPTKARVTRDLQRGEEIRHRARQADIPQDVELGRLQRPHHVFEFGLGGGEPGRDVDDDRERCT